MANRKHSAPRYVDLGKSSALIQRRLEPQTCGRLLSATVGLDHVDAELQFAIDDRGRVSVSGRACARVAMECHLCTEALPLEVSADIDGVLARDEAEAQSWQSQDLLNIIVVSGQELNVVELIEDELILNLPARVCVDDTCSARPAMDYEPAAEELELAAHSNEERENPFAVLEQLKSPGQDN